MVYMVVQYGLHGRATRSIRSCNMGSMGMQYSLYGRAIWCTRSCNLVYTVVQRGLYGRATWSIWQCNMVYTVVQHSLYGRATWSIWWYNMVYKGVKYGLLQHRTNIYIHIPLSRVIPPCSLVGMYHRNTFRPEVTRRMFFSPQCPTTCSYELSWFPSWLWR